MQIKKNIFKFEEQLKQKYGGDTIMGLREYLLTTAKNEGMQAGMEAGMEKGKHKKAIAIALEFKKMGLPIEDIAKGTGLSIEEIKNLK